MMRTLIALTLALVLTLCGLGYSVSKVYEYKDAASVAQKELVQAQARTTRIQALVQQADKDAAKARSDLRKALDAYPTWRDAVVPVPVYDSLCNTLRCDPARSVPPSGSAP